MLLTLRYGVAPFAPICRHLRARLGEGACSLQDVTNCAWAIAVFATEKPAPPRNVVRSEPDAG